MNRTVFNFNETEEPQTESRSNEPLPAGVYPARVIDSCYERTKTEVVVNAKGEYVRRVRDYHEGGGYTDNPITNEERQSGCKVTSSGTYIYLRLGCDVEGLQWPKNVLLRLNLENLIADPWSGRKLFRQLGKALGLTDTGPMDLGHPVPALHDRPFLVELKVKNKRGSSGEKENEAESFAPLSGQRPSYLSQGAEVVDVVSSDPRPMPPISAYNDRDMF